MAGEPYRPLQVAQILDASTVVVAGEGAQDLQEEDELQILAVGREIPGVGAPLVVPKAFVYVESNTGAYVIARTGTSEKEVPIFNVFSTTRTVHHRKQMNVNEKQVVGNPGTSPVGVGDPVARTKDIAAFMAYIKEQAQVPKDA